MPEPYVWSGSSLIKEIAMPWGASSSPSVSVLLPTRKRVNLLVGVLDSLIGLASTPNAVEVLLKIDEDDDWTLSSLNQLNSLYPFRAFVGPRGGGYHDMHHWNNYLASKALGNWLVVFNDDARILTPAWDQHVSAYSPGGDRGNILLLLFHIINKPGARELFAVWHGVYDLFGYLSPVVQTDMWLSTVLDMAQRAIWADVKVNHLNETIADQTSEERRAVQRAVFSGLVGTELTRRRLDDVKKLLDHLDGRRA